MGGAWEGRGRRRGALEKRQRGHCGAITVWEGRHRGVGGASAQGAHRGVKGQNKGVRGVTVGWEGRGRGVSTVCGVSSRRGRGVTRASSRRKRGVSTGAAQGRSGVSSRRGRGVSTGAAQGRSGASSRRGRGVGGAPPRRGRGVFVPVDALGLVLIEALACVGGVAGIIFDGVEQRCWLANPPAANRNF